MWNEIQTPEDIEKLMSEYGGFHDSCIVSVSYESGAAVDNSGGMFDGSAEEHRVLMKLNSQWCLPIELEFTGVRRCSIVGWQENYFCDISGAYLGFHTDLLGRTRDDLLIVWADSSSFDPSRNIDEKVIPLSGNGCTYVVAEGLRWRLLNE